MKKKINCFIPFGNPKDTIQTVKELQASELVNKIYLLSADTNKECLPGVNVSSLTVSTLQVRLKQLLTTQMMPAIFCFTRNRPR